MPCRYPAVLGQPRSKHPPGIHERPDHLQEQRVLWCNGLGLGSNPNQSGALGVSHGRLAQPKVALCGILQPLNATRFSMEIRRRPYQLILPDVDVHKAADEKLRKHQEALDAATKRVNALKKEQAMKLAERQGAYNQTLVRIRDKSIDEVTARNKEVKDYHKNLAKQEAHMRDWRRRSK